MTPTLIFLAIFSVNAMADLPGQALYDSKCSKCHGKTGGGDGKSASKLDTKPTAFDDGKAFKDKKGLALSPEARMKKVIREGGEAAKMSKEMDSYPDLSDQQINDLFDVLKSFAKE
jgi:mono/diheme cytochrome c family protein